MLKMLIIFFFVNCYFQVNGEDVIMVMYGYVVELIKLSGDVVMLKIVMVKSLLVNGMDQLDGKGMQLLRIREVVKCFCLEIWECGSV